jgi:hypothetical protein
LILIFKPFLRVSQQLRTPRAGNAIHPSRKTPK